MGNTLRIILLNVIVFDHNIKMNLDVETERFIVIVDFLYEGKGNNLEEKRLKIVTVPTKRLRVILILDLTEVIFDSVLLVDD